MSPCRTISQHLRTHPAHPSHVQGLQTTCAARPVMPAAQLALVSLLRHLDEPLPCQLPCTPHVLLKFARRCFDLPGEHTDRLC